MPHVEVNTPKVLSIPAVITWMKLHGHGGILIIVHPIGVKKANELGLFDMSGNATEWCWDLSLKYPNDPTILLVNPIGPTLEEYIKVKNKRYRIARGGSSGSSERLLFTTYHRAGLFEFGVGAGGPGIRLARNASE